MGTTIGTGRTGGPVAEINVTPMIDVMLVLLIIFMVVQPGLQRGVRVQVPPPVPAVEPSPTPPENFVLEVRADGSHFLNQQPVPAGALEGYLAGVFAERPRKVLFVEGDEAAAYAEVVRAVDAARTAGVEVVGLVPRGEQGNRE